MLHISCNPFAKIAMIDIPIIQAVRVYSTTNVHEVVFLKHTSSCESSILPFSPITRALNSLSSNVVTAKSESDLERSQTRKHRSYVTHIRMINSGTRWISVYSDVSLVPSSLVQC
jgi:hypothetical protein